MPSRVLSQNSYPVTRPSVEDRVRKLYRNQTTINVGTVSTHILGPNPQRVALVLSTPVWTPFATGQPVTIANQSGHAQSGAATGVFFTYTSPANTITYVDDLNYHNNNATQCTFFLEYTPSGGTTAKVGAANSNNIGALVPYGIELAPGDAIDLNITVLQAGNNFDWALFMRTQPTTLQTTGTDNTVWVDCITTAVVGQGMPLHPGAPPLVLLYDHVGQALRESMRAIAASAAVNITIWDIFEVDCPCGVSPQMG